MTLNLTRARQFVAGLSLLAGLGLAGCTDKSEDAAPETIGCGTTAIVRLCLGKTLMCPTEHTTLELLDGTRLLPSGPIWEAYELNQVDGMPVSIGYTLTSPGPNTGAATADGGRIGDFDATITCLEPIVWRCGTSDYMNRTPLSPLRRIKSR